MGRLNSMTTSGWRDRNSDDGYVSNVPLVKNVQYDLAGKMTSMQRIASVVPVPANDPQFGIAYTTETRAYNVNEQLTSIGWNSANWVPNYGNLDPGPDGNLTYQYSATQNNGQITGMSDTLSGDTVTYQYDSLKRLISASAAGWSQNYGYDGFGNLTSKTTNGTTVNYPADPATNRISNGNVGSAGMYDANGNMTGAPGSILGYDVANHVVSSNISGAVERYAYNAQNRRFYIRKSDGTEQLVFYGAYQEKVSDGFGQPVLWFGGRMIWEGNKPVNPDRVSSNRSGGAAYYPYGEERGTATANDHTKFAAYTRDSFSGLDYAVNRWYLPGQGRFGTPDPYQATATQPSDPSAPTSWNRYAYVANDPVNWLDSKGLSATCPECIASVTGFAFSDPSSSVQSGGSGGSGVKNRALKPVEDDAGGVDVSSIVRNAERAAADRLFNPDCAGLFLTGSSNTSEARKDLAAKLDDLENGGFIRVLSPGQVTGLPSNVPAFTAGSTAIYLISGGAFFTGTVDGKSLGGFASNMSLPSFQQLVIIHEFLHYSGIVGADSTGQSYVLPNGDKVIGSAGVSEEVKTKCFN